MDRLEVRALLARPERALPAALQLPGISIDDSLDEEAFLKALEESLQQHVASLPRQFLVLSAPQVDRLAFRLRDALEPKRDTDTHVVQAWTIQPQLQLKVKARSHLQVLKLSTILREVQCLRVHQPQGALEIEQRRPIEIEIFPSLRIVEALNTEASALRNVHFFARQLRELHIEHTQVSALQELLAPEAEKQDGKVDAAPWRKLHKLQVNCCALETLDDSANLLRAVRTLDLGWNQIERVETALATRSLESLNLCHNKLQQVPLVKGLRSLRGLDLAVNQVASLRGLETLTGLESLDLSHNRIADIAEVELLMRLPRLAYLKLAFNPIARRPDYRREVLFYLGEQIELDGQPWSEAELSSMKDRRMLLMLDEAKERSSYEGIWGQSVEPAVYPKARVQSGVMVRSPKLVMGYPPLASSQSVVAHYVEIQDPPSTLPTQKNKGNTSSSRSTNVVSSDGSLDSSGGASQSPVVSTVGDYFRTRRDVVISKEKAVEKDMNRTKDSAEEGTPKEIGEEGPTGPRGKRARTRSRKYTASDFMRDFEEEESLVRDGNDMEDLEVLVSRSTSQSQLASPQHPGQSVSVRVLLSAKEAAEYDLHFGIDGAPATIEVKSRKLIERFVVSDGKDPIAISRWLPDVVALGTSIRSSRAKIVTMKLQPRASSLVDAAYQIDSTAALEVLLSTLVARLYQQHKGCVIVCNCANCGALSLLTKKYPERTDADNATMVYSCLLCASRNVREISFKKLVAVCASEDIAIPSSIPLAPPPWETLTEGFYIEEPAADTAAMQECVLVSCNGIREVAASGRQEDESDTRGVHSDEWNDAIVNAMTTVR